MMASLQPIELDVTIHFDSPLWLVWSNEHRAWWAAESKGYATHVCDAGRYTLRVANRICDPRNVTKGVPDEVIVPSPELVERMMKVQGELAA